MDRFAKLQFVGPAALFATVAMAESAAWALDRYPASTALWHVNLVWFGIFQRSHYVFNAATDIAYGQLLFVALPIFVLACYGLFFRRRLMLAIASNLSLVFAGFLLFSWWANEASAQQASLTIVTPSQPDFYVCMALLAFSLLSFAGSHLAYLQRLRTSR
jgi:NADH:ubiquinone oxidoreductase subunit K